MCGINILLQGLLMFGSSLFRLLMTYFEKEFNHSVLQGHTGKYQGTCENFAFVELSYEYMMVARLIGIWRANTIASSIFFSFKPQLLMQFIVKESFNGSCYCWCCVILYRLNFVWKWCVGWFVINNIFIIKIRSYERFMNDQ